MLGIPEIKEIWESVQQNKEAVRKQIDKWIKDGVAAIRDYADGKDNNFRQRLAMLLHGASLQKHLSMALTQLMKSNAG